MKNVRTVMSDLANSGSVNLEDCDDSGNENDNDEDCCVIGVMWRCSMLIEQHQQLSPHSNVVSFYKLRRLIQSDHDQANRNRKNIIVGLVESRESYCW
mmetsp:Transcript_25320/g.28404  ORF Transcript_25320/g.28404 Transcript_25320/m.28404 type:complete len:98 (-) Transcript_25320:133-426(-)